MSQQHNDECPIEIPCQVEGATLTPFLDEPAEPCLVQNNPIIKVPAVLAETIIQVVVETNIVLDPPASEIKRVHKDVYLTQCKLVPVEFGDEVCPGVFEVTRAKLFVAGFIRKNIEYATGLCNGVIRDRIITTEFSGYADLRNGDFDTFPVLGRSSDSRSRYINPKNSEIPRLDKYFFENSVYYNEQPYCELVNANFFELDFSPCPVGTDETFTTLREKIVCDLTVKVLQLRQVRVPSIGNGGNNL